METIVQHLLKRPITLLMGAMIILFLAIYFGLRLPVSITPEAEFPRLSIRTAWTGTSSEIMTEQVTTKIEEVVAATKGVKKISSTTREGLSLIQVEFEKNIDQQLVRIEISEYLEQLWQTLPYGVSKPIIEKFIPKEYKDLQGFMVYQFYSKPNSSLSSALIKDQLEKFLIPRLNSLNGIGEISIYGASSETIIIELNDDLMRLYQVTKDEVMFALNRASKNVNYGNLLFQDKVILLRSKSAFSSLLDIESILISNKVSSKQPTQKIKLSDIAKVSFQSPEQTGYFRINAKEAVTLIVNREANSNSLELSNQIENEIHSILQSELSSLSAIKAVDKTDLLRKELIHLRTDLILAVVAIFILLMIFFKNVRLTAIVLLNIIFALTVSFLTISALGYSLNLITIAGMILVFGILTDNAIVVIDSIDRKLHQISDPFAAISEGTALVFLPLLASTFTTIGALIPILFLPDEIRLYFIEFVVSVSASLLASLLISFTLIPSLIYHYTEIRISRLTKGEMLFSNVYLTILSAILANPKKVILVIVLVLGIPIYLLPDSLETKNNESHSFFRTLYNDTFGSSTFQIIKPYLNYALGGSSYLFFRYVSRGEFFGGGNETYLNVSISAPQGTATQYLNEITSRFETPLLQYTEGITYFISEISGTSADITVYFNKTDNLTLPYIVKGQLTAIAARVGGANVGVYGYGPGFYSGAFETNTYTIKAFGYNYDKLKELSQQLKEALESNPRVDNCKIDKAYGYYESGKEITVNINRLYPSPFNLSFPDMVSDFMGKAQGLIAYQPFMLNQREYTTEIKYASSERTTTSEVLNDFYLFGEIPTRYSEVFDLKKRPVLSEILRENQQYLRWITFDYKGRYDYGQRHLESVITRFQLPLGYEFKQAQFVYFNFSDKDTINYIYIALLSLLIVFLVTAALYESLTKPFLIIIAIPFSLIGVFLSFYFFDANFGRGGYISLLLLSGITVNNSIVLIDRMIKIVDSRPYSERLSGILEASLDRLRPIVITSVLTLASLLPMLFRAEESSIWYGLTVGVLGGVISSSLLVLLVLPAVFLVTTKRLR